MGQRVLIKSGGGSSTGTLSDNGNTLPIVTLPSDPGYIYEVTLAFSVEGAGAGGVFTSNASGLAINIGASDSISIGRDSIESGTAGAGPVAQVTVSKHGPSTPISVTYFAVGAIGDYAYTYSYIGKKVVDDNF
jgi:hypothetical protein